LLAYDASRYGSDNETTDSTVVAKSPVPGKGSQRQMWLRNAEEQELRPISVRCAMVTTLSSLRICSLQLDACECPFEFIGCRAGRASGFGVHLYCDAWVWLTKF